MKRRNWTRSRIIHKIRNCHRRAIPVGRIWRECRGAMGAAIKLFGSWREALVAAGLQSPRQRWTRERVIQELQLRSAAVIKKNEGRLAAAAIRYFGNWRQALLAAGLPARKPLCPPLRWTRAEVLAAIQRRQEQGLSLTAVGREDRPLYAVAKRTFGSWRLALCAAGFPPPARKIWTAEEILQAIHDRQAQDLSLTGVEYQATSLYRAAKRVFGGWQKALCAAGIEVEPRQRWNRERVIAAIRQRHQQGAPLTGLWRADKPLFRAAVTHLGNWQTALQAAGINFRRRKKWSAERIIECLHGWNRQGEVRIYVVDPGLAGAASRFFGSLKKAWEGAGIDPPERKWNKRRVVETIQDGYVRGLLFEFVGFKDKRLAAAAKRYFGTWRGAVDAAGLLQHMPPLAVKREWSAEAVIEAIRSRSPDGGIGPVSKEDTGLYSAARKHFGSWRAALLAAGLQTKRREWSPQSVIQGILARYERGLDLVSSAVFREDCRLGGAALRHFGSWRETLLAAGIDPSKVAATARKQEKGAIA